jgi:hypothetical protein
MGNFTYTGNETRSITKLFKEFNINISYRTRNTIENILKQDHIEITTMKVGSMG